MDDGVRLSDKSAHFILPTETLRPLRDTIVVRCLDLPLSSKIIAAFTGETVRGEVIAAGPGRYPNRHYRGKRDGKEWRHIKPSQVFRKTEVKVGDIVQLGGMELGGYLFPHIQINGQDHIIATEQDVALIEQRAP